MKISTRSKRVTSEMKRNKIGKDNRNEKRILKKFAPLAGMYYVLSLPPDDKQKTRGQFKKVYLFFLSVYKIQQLMSWHV